MPPTPSSDAVGIAKRHRIHLSGPMTGLVNLNEYAFRVAAERIRGLGHEVFSPHDLETETPYRKALIMNLTWIFGHATAQVLLRGSEASPGSRAERAYAEALGLPQYVEADGQYYLLNRFGRTLATLGKAPGLHVVGDTDEG